MKRALIRTADDVKVSVVVLADDWTGAEGEWQIPDGHYLDADLSNVPPAPAPTADNVKDECDRRLAMGFDHDFQDSRGVHTIATTERDMEGWREVTDIANARIATSDTTAITIATETGVAQVSPLEWMDVLKAAAAFRQPIWAASFALQAMDPIPSDYTDDSYWTSE